MDAIENNTLFAYANNIIMNEKSEAETMTSTL